MLFALICTDKPDALALRQATRPAHLAFLDAHISVIVQAGALLDADQRPAGSLLVIDVADEAAARDFAAADPYAAAGLFASVVIQPFRQAYKDGVRLV